MPHRSKEALPASADSKKPSEMGGAVSESGSTKSQRKSPAPIAGILYPSTLRFIDKEMEGLYAQFVQRQAARNLWWSCLILALCVFIEFLVTSTTTPGFDPINNRVFQGYTIGTLTIVTLSVGASLISRTEVFVPWAEIVIAAGGTLLTAMMVFFSDHWRVARLLGDGDPHKLWHTNDFSDGPLLLGLIAIILSVCVFLPVRCLCLWPISVSAILSFTGGTFVLDVPNGIRSSVMDVVLLIVLIYVAFCGRRALERQLRMQFYEVYQAGAKIRKLETKVAELRRRQAETEKQTPTTLEFLFDSLKEAQKTFELVQSKITDLAPDLFTQMTTGIEQVRQATRSLSRIDSLLQVNVSALLDKKGQGAGLRSASASSEGAAAFLESTRSFIATNFTRGGEDADGNRFGVPRRQLAKVKWASLTNPRTRLHRAYAQAPYGGVFTAQHDLTSNLPALCVGIGREWNFDFFELTKKTGNNALVATGLYVLEPFLETFLNVNRQVALSFLSEIQRRYRPNTYHNAQHGADVCHSALWLSNAVGVFERISAIEQLALLVAGLCHDVGHPGRNNAFQVATGDSLAITYNDVAVLENMHASQTFEVLGLAGCQLTKNLSLADRKAFRSFVIELILETDMSRHFESIAKFKVRRQTPEFSLEKRPEDRYHAAKMCIKAADIGHAAKGWTQHYAYSLAVTEEFFAQGDRERALGLPISPLCDRAKQAELPQSQAGFLQIVCLDLFKELASVETHTEAENETRAAEATAIRDANQDPDLLERGSLSQGASSCSSPSVSSFSSDELAEIRDGAPSASNGDAAKRTATLQPDAVPRQTTSMLLGWRGRGVQSPVSAGQEVQIRCVNTLQDNKSKWESMGVAYTAYLSRTTAQQQNQPQISLGGLTRAPASVSTDVISVGSGNQQQQETTTVITSENADPAMAFLVDLAIVRAQNEAQNGKVKGTLPEGSEKEERIQLTDTVIPLLPSLAHPLNPPASTVQSSEPNETETVPDVSGASLSEIAEGDEAAGTESNPKRRDTRYRSKGATPKPARSPRGLSVSPSAIPDRGTTPRGTRSTRRATISTQAGSTVVLPMSFLTPPGERAHGESPHALAHGVSPCTDNSLALSVTASTPGHRLASSRAIAAGVTPSPGSLHARVTFMGDDTTPAGDAFSHRRGQMKTVGFGVAEKGEASADRTSSTRNRRSRTSPAMHIAVAAAGAASAFHEARGSHQAHTRAVRFSLDP
uniref:Phosphodiesterase n=1 Tax=Chromera velia CCMP2878 TaxID=1169474 RepID=A0A0G4HHK7_9ALVE|eukprot:Cvel_6878.t1-p1 / transcript=Cvel_6878.t1 / gene=Cvel_6878 / organism=Chromera_velia_CCMP2878 / gene_product=Calcium/calmodulin-dependent 3',5'-cyclic, putative / transcript_product=Calcium/calmodulin-dependent 3',5'-cyclic, putative / location=Cvel_scaffold348:728-6835(+) / protein_length=1228 / sequence_SO=supercontig / SO=protein_coding / is_pseudo=false